MSTNMANRDENLFMAKLAESAGCYEDMLNFMKNVVAASDGEELSSEERGLLSFAYKSVMDDLMTSCRVIDSLQEEERRRHESAIKDYRSKIVTKISTIVDGLSHCHRYLPELKYAVENAAEPPSSFIGICRSDVPDKIRVFKKPRLEERPKSPTPPRLDSFDDEEQWLLAVLKPKETIADVLRHRLKSVGVEFVGVSYRFVQKWGKNGKYDNFFFTGNRVHGVLQGIDPDDLD